MSHAATNAENNYDYAGQDPVNNYDLDGRYWIPGTTTTVKLTHSAAARLADRLHNLALWVETGGEIASKFPGIPEWLGITSGITAKQIAALANTISVYNNQPKSKGIIIKVGLGSTHWYLPPNYQYKVMTRFKGVHSGGKSTTVDTNGW